MRCCALIFLNKLDTVHSFSVDSFLPDRMVSFPALMHRRPFFSHPPQGRTLFFQQPPLGHLSWLLFTFGLFVLLNALLPSQQPSWGHLMIPTQSLPMLDSINHRWCCHDCGSAKCIREGLHLLLCSDCLSTALPSHSPLHPSSALLSLIFVVHTVHTL